MAIKGYTGQFLEVDLTAKTFKTVPLDENLARQYIGGRALGVRMLINAYGANWAKVDPLGPDALLYLFGGPLTGYCATKVMAVFKSPTSGGAVGSAASGDFITQLKFAGYDGLILKGKAAAPTTLFIEDDKVRFDDASKLWGKNTYETQGLIDAQYGNTYHSVYVGPAGENMCKNASIMTVAYRACGRGGSGAVMGSKNLKAIVVKGNKPAPEVTDAQALAKIMEWARVNPPVVRASFHEYGTTPGIYDTANRLSASPVKNWQSEWHDAVELRAEMIAAEHWVRRYWADYACTVACSKLGRVKTGKRAGQITELPDYEAVYEGPGWGIFNRDDLAFAADVPDKWGFDLIGLGNLLAWTAECYQKGVLTKEDLGGVDLKWGDADAFAKMAEMVAKRQGIGNTLAEGTLAAAKKIGKGSEAWAVQVKGIEVGAHGTRSQQDFIVLDNAAAYACETQGGDHTSVAGKTGEMGIINDTLVTCNFCGVGLPQAIEYLNAITGYGYTQQDLQTKFVPAWATQQMVTVRLAGWTTKDDTNPPRFYEPLPDGPYKGKTTDKALEDQQKQAYYKLMGWDAKGIPTTDTLKKYGLEAFDAALAPMRA